MRSHSRCLALLQVFIALTLPIPGCVVALVIPSPKRLVVALAGRNNQQSSQSRSGIVGLGLGLVASPLVSNDNESDNDNNNESAYDCDILVLGSGPAGRAVSRLLEQKNLQVCLADATYDRPLVPNYGVWKDEWDAVVARYAQGGVDITGGTYGKALNREWGQTDCFFGGSYGKTMTERTVIDRPYCQVDKDALKQSLTTGSTSQGIKIIRANHQSKATSVNIYSPPGTLVHDEQGTTTVLKDCNGNEITVRSKLVVDTTGHESKLVLRDARAPANGPPGFQIAYGCLLKINEPDPENAVTFGPYDKEAMTLFDYRTDHLEFDPKWEQRAIEEPTFMYVMPLEKNRVFFEETSLVARPAISFQECKDRCFKRLEYLGINVAEIEEEEYCYIPMGGSLPLKDQRVIALGGSAAMVHPATGYHLCRMLMGAANVADAISKELSRQEEDQFKQPNLDRAAASAYHSIWNPETIRQRNFAVFGGEFLMKQNVVGLRGFFDGFFKLPLELWAGFLAGWPGLPNNDKHESWHARIWFGINFLVRLPTKVAVDMVAAIVEYSLAEGAPLPQSVTPFLGAPPSYEYRDFGMENVGDRKVKAEAKRLIMESKVTELLPPAFEDGVEEETVLPTTGSEDALEDEPAVVEAESLADTVTAEAATETVEQIKMQPAVEEETVLPTTGSEDALEDEPAVAEAESLADTVTAEAATETVEQIEMQPAVEDEAMSFTSEVSGENEQEFVAEQPITDAVIEHAAAETEEHVEETMLVEEPPLGSAAAAISDSAAAAMEETSILDNEVNPPTAGNVQESITISASSSPDFSQNSFE